MNRDQRIATELEEFTNEELVARLRAGLPLSARQRRDAERLLVGKRVYVVTDPKYVGQIELILDNQARVRWHKGYATWEDIHMLRL